MLLQSAARRTRTPASSLLKRGFRVHGTTGHEAVIHAAEVDSLVEIGRGNTNQEKQTFSILRENISGNAALSTRLRKSPYFDRTVSSGVKEFTVYNRMLMPIVFDGHREYKALTEDVAIWDVAAERQVQLKGPDAGKLTWSGKSFDHRR